jgi:hypothetical protein
MCRLSIHAAVLLLACLAAALPARAADEPRCALGDIVLWGDGEHDDTAALNAWFRGEAVVWANSGEPVGEAIADRSFRLSAAVYVTGGTGRRLEHFRMIWPERGETVTGGTIAAGDDPAAAPAISGIDIVGGDPDEGVPFEAPAPVPAEPTDPAACATS